jgi:hypothetical protein
MIDDSINHQNRVDILNPDDLVEVDVAGPSTHLPILNSEQSIVNTHFRCISKHVGFKRFEIIDMEFVNIVKSSLVVSREVRCCRTEIRKGEFSD